MERDLEMLGKATDAIGRLAEATAAEGLERTSALLRDAHAAIGFEVADYRLPVCGECGRARVDEDMVSRINRDRGAHVEGVGIGSLD